MLNKGIIDEEFIRSYVKENLWQLDKDILIDIADSLYGVPEDTRYKEKIIEFIHEHDDVDYLDIYNMNRRTAFAVTGGKMAELLGVELKIVKKMAKKNWLTIPYTIEQKIHGRIVDVSCYSLYELLTLTKEDVNEFIEKKCRTVTEKQKEALERGRATSIKNRTCTSCGKIVGKKEYLRESMCIDCIREANRKEERDLAKLTFESYLENKDKYILLDTETTGLDYTDEIVEISIIDMDGNVLLDTLIYTNVDISPEASNVNGIIKEMLSGKPTIKDLTPKLNEIFKDKTVLIYNEDFDTRMLYQSGFEGDIKSECLMNLYMQLCNSERWISLSNAMLFEDVEEIQNHRALGDCQCCLALIKKIAED